MAEPSIPAGEKKKTKPASLKPNKRENLGCLTPIPLRTGKAVDLQGVPHEISPTQLTEIEKLSQSCESSLTEDVRVCQTPFLFWSFLTFFQEEDEANKKTG